jgi:hypothetical protein
VRPQNLADRALPDVKRWVNNWVNLSGGRFFLPVGSVQSEPVGDNLKSTVGLVYFCTNI